MIETADAVDMNDVYKTFRKIKTDSGRWQFLIDNAELELVVYLDNDDTFISFSDEGDKVVHFDDYIGCTHGVQILLDKLGILYERV